VTQFGDLVADPGERELVIGTSRAGKSSYVDWGMRYVQEHRPTAMQVLVDSKPRFRAETEKTFGKNRRSAAWRYKSWAKGPVIPNSVLVSLYDDHPFRGMWKTPGEVAVMQSGDETDWRRMLVLLNAFCKAQIGELERFIRVDEVLDFYGRNTMGIMPKNDVFYRAARAGGERKIGISLGAHRVHGLPPLIRTVASRVTLFHLTDDADMRELKVCGIHEPTSPDPDTEGAFTFRQWKKQPGGAMGEPVTCCCEYPESYLSQLAAS
jgi:hypothetical protein